jgi:hypothetical protein
MWCAIITKSSFLDISKINALKDQLIQDLKVNLISTSFVCAEPFQQMYIIQYTFNAKRVVTQRFGNASRKGR